MNKRFFRLKDLGYRPEQIEWIEMTGREYYLFVTDPQNKDRRFLDMGDVVLECTKDEYKMFKAEDDHSSYISEQKESVTIVSLDSWEQQDTLNPMDTIIDMNTDVECCAIQNIMKQALHKALRDLPDEDVWIIEKLYLEEPHKTLRQLSKESGIPVMTLRDRRIKIISALRAAIAPPKIFYKKSEKFPYKIKKSSQ